MAIFLLILNTTWRREMRIAAIIRRASPLPVIENASLIINKNDDRRPVAGDRKSLDSRNE